MMKVKPTFVALAAALVALPSASEAAFVFMFDPSPLELTPGSPTGTVNLIATNTGSSADDLSFFTINLGNVVGSPDITIDAPATISHFGGPFVGGAGVGPGNNVVLGSFSFTMSGAVMPTGIAPITTSFSGDLFSQSTSGPAVVQTPMTATVNGVPEPSSALLLLTAAGLGLVRRQRN